MQSQILKRSLVYLLLAASFALSPASAPSQQRRAAPTNLEVPVIPQAGCPKPIALTLNATQPNVVAADFSQGQLNAQHNALGQQTTPNRNFIHTFQWVKDQKCCQITRAVLTVKMKSIQAGTKGGSDASNDGIAIMFQQNAVAPYNELVYLNVTQPFTAGTPATKQWVLNQTVLNIINTYGRLSFAVQDDTAVVSATLQLTGCCLFTPQRDTAEASSITGSTH